MKFTDKLGYLRYLVDKRGGRGFTDGDEGVVAALAAQAGAALANARLSREASLQEAWRDALARVTMAAMAGREAWESLGEVAGAARSLAHADLALVTGTGGGRGAPRVLAADGTAACRLLGLPARPGPPAGRLIADISGQEPPVAGLPRVAAAIAVPMRARTGASETLWVMRARRRPAFDPALPALVESFGEQVARVLDRARPEEELPAAREDHDRLTRALHDDVVQTLFGIGMELLAAAQRVRGDEVASRLEEAASYLDSIIGRVRAHDGDPAREPPR